MNNRKKQAVCLCVLVLACVGCEQPSQPGGATTNQAANAPRLPPPVMVPSSPVVPVAAPGDAPPEAAAGAIPPVVDQPAVPPPPVAEPPPSPPPVPPAPSPPPATAATPAIRLSTGVALAQTLPDGTGMLCSMDYQWTAGGPLQGVEYVWVIELGDGQRMSGSANLSKRNGTVQAVLRGIRPERGPFKGAVFAKSPSPGIAPKQLSDFIQLTN